MKHADYVFAIKITKDSNEIVINDYVITLGSLEEQLYNYNDRNNGGINYPTITVQVFNKDGEFTVGHTNSLFNNGIEDTINGWQLKFRLQRYVDETLETVYDWLSFDIDDIEYQQGTCTLTCVHPLFRIWSKRWDYEVDSHYVNWSGLQHYGPLWTW